MCTWDLVDGQCIESVKLHQIHSYIQVFNFYPFLLYRMYFEALQILNENKMFSPHCRAILWEEQRMLTYSALEIIQK